MPAQVMKASHLGWVDFTKGLVNLPPAYPPAESNPAAERNNSEVRRGNESGRGEALRLAIAGLPMSVLAMAAVPALAQSSPNPNYLASSASDLPSLVDPQSDAPNIAVPIGDTTNSNAESQMQSPPAQMIRQNQKQTIAVPKPDVAQSISVMTFRSTLPKTPAEAATISAGSTPQSSEFGMAALSGAGGLLLARRRSPIK